jgi:hypothetical protein
MRFHLLTLLLSFIVSINALHFYLDANQKRCFIEEIPTDTVVEGMTGIYTRFSHFGNSLLSPGHYRALEWNDQQNTYWENPELGIVVLVQVRCHISGTVYPF